MAPDIGPEVGPYRVIRRLGVGGMGTVLLAEDVRLRRSVALKTITDPESATPEARQRLMREARAAAAISHPHIAAVHDVLDINDQIVIVFEYVEGETLSVALGRGPLPLGRAVEIALELADALDAAHAHGVVHRDLKPANVALSPQGHAVVLDFGIARTLPAADASTQDESGSGGALVGTPGYAAPEQWTGHRADVRSDLYSLGVVLFEMIAGRRPFEDNDVLALGQAVMQRPAPKLSSLVRVPHEIDVLVAALLERDALERPQSAREVIAALRTVRGELETAPEAQAPATRWQRKDRLRRRSVAAAGLLGAAAVTALLVAGWSGFFEPDAPARPPVVAVLPLNAAGGDLSQDYLAAGMAESLITRLASLPSITVLSRAAVADARAGQHDLSRLIRDLDVAYLVETTVQQSGEALRVTLNVVGRDGSVVWGDTFDGFFDRIFELQSRIATAVSQALQVRVSAEERKRFDEQPTTSPEALEAYWRGRGLLERRDVAGNLEGAVEAFSEAVRLDPRFALAHAALGEAYWTKNVVTSDPQWAPRATEAGMEALRLAPDQAPVRYALGLTLSGSGRLDEAVEELQRALILQPGYDDARRELGVVLSRQGKTDEAVAEFDKAIALRPNFAGHWGQKGVALYRAARFEEAADAFRREIELQPDGHLGYQRLGATYQQLGDNEAAIRQYERANAIRPSGGAYANLGALLHLSGEYEKAIEAYQQGLKLAPNRAINYHNIGDAYRKLGRLDEARAAYRDAVRVTEALLQVNQRDARSLAELAVYLAKLDDAPAALDRIEQARGIAPDDVEVQYKTAVVHALAGRVDEAMPALERALELGYSRVRAAGDEDLAPLHGREDFDALVSPRE